MNVKGTPTRTIWPAREGGAVWIIDQTRLPHEFVTQRLNDLGAVAHAIRAMLVRGAPLIGATAAYGVALGMAEDPSDEGLTRACQTLLATRPTAVNLRWAIEAMAESLAAVPPTSGRKRPGPRPGRSVTRTWR